MFFLISEHRAITTREDYKTKPREVVIEGLKRREEKGLKMGREIFEKIIGIKKIMMF